MSNKFREISIKNHAYYFFDDIINIKNFDPNKFKVDEKLYKHILLYYIGYVTSASTECDICLYLYFLNKGFKFQPYLCNRCHELLMVSMNLSDIAILKIKNTDYCCMMKLAKVKL